jgi:hypothetical protein
MRNHLAFILAIAFLLSGSLSAHAQKAFEGTVYWTLSVPQMDSEKHEMKINVRGEKTETEIDLGIQGGVKSFIDRDKKKIYVVLEAMHSGMYMDIPSDSAAHAIASKEILDLKPTGKKEIINGHPSEEFVIQTPKANIDLWAASDFPKSLCESMHHAIASQPGQDPQQQKMLSMLADKGLFPIKIIVMEGTEVATTMEFVKYEEKPLDNAIFELPKDIKFTPAPKMPGM